MKTCKLFEKKVLPQFEAIGYIYNYLDKNMFCFSNCENSVQIRYDIHTAFGARFLRENAREVRVILSIKFCKHWITFETEQLSSVFFNPTDYFFKNQDDFVQVLGDLTEKVITIIVPKLEALVKYAVYPKEIYYKKLSMSTSQQAKDFAIYNKRDEIWSNENKAWAYTWVHEMLPVQPELKKTVFEHNINQLISFAAFIGEIFKKKGNGEWRWMPNPQTGEQKFGVYFSDVGDGYDILELLISYWNFSSDLKHITLFPNF